jgi:hypothetical protein
MESSWAVHPQESSDTTVGWNYAAVLRNLKEAMKNSDERMIQRMPCFFMPELRYMSRKAIAATRDWRFEYATNNPTGQT